MKVVKSGQPGKADVLTRAVQIIDLPNARSIQEIEPRCQHAKEDKKRECIVGALPRVSRPVAIRQVLATGIATTPFTARGPTFARRLNHNTKTDSTLLMNRRHFGFKWEAHR